jgi:membrane associated rhomboid family serine protease
MKEIIQPVAPWLCEAAFPEKPPDSEYGYLEKRKFVPCSREELVRRCSLDEVPGIQLIWYPDAPRLVPIAHAPFLADALKERLRKRLHTSLGIGMVSLVIYGGIICLAWGGGHGHSIYLLMFLSIGLIPVLQSSYGLHKLKKLNSESISEEGATHLYQAWVDSRPVRFTWILLSLVVIVFSVEAIRSLSEAIAAAGLDKHAVWRGEWWRLFTGPLMHGSVIHLLFNATALFGLGRIVELLASRYHLALVFAVSALSGSIFSLFLLPNTTSVGASGGLMGLIGFLGILGWRRKHLLPPGFVKSVVINIVIVAVMGIVAFAIIDNAAHFGGLVGGALAGIFLIGRNDQTLPIVCGRPVKILGALAMLGTVFFAAFAIIKIWK